MNSTSEKTSYSLGAVMETDEEPIGLKVNNDNKVNYKATTDPLVDNFASCDCDDDIKVIEMEHEDCHITYDSKSERLANARAILEKFLADDESQESKSTESKPNLPDDIAVIDTHFQDNEPKDRIWEKAEEFKEKGNRHFRNKEYYQALEWYTEAIEQLTSSTNSPSSAKFFGNRAACYMELKKYKEALKDIRKSLELNPTYEKGYVRLIRTTLCLGNVKECKRAFETVANKGIKVLAEFEYKVLRRLIRMKQDIAYCRAKKDDRKLILLVTQALETATDDSSLKLAKAEALVRLGRCLEAKEIATKVIKGDCGCVQALHIQASCLNLEGDLERCIQVLKQLLQHVPDGKEREPYELFLKKTTKLFQLREASRKKFGSKDFEGAALDLEKCLALVQADEIVNTTMESKICFNLCLIAYQRNERDKCIEYCTKAIQLDSQFIMPIFYRAKLYHEMEMIEDALRDYDAALKLDPNNRDLQNARLAAKKSSRKSFYTILGVNKNATEDDIRKAYKKRALLHHPDRHANSPELVQRQQEGIFKDLKGAYDVLINCAKRSKYDREFESDSMGDRLCESSRNWFGNYKFWAREFCKLGFHNDGFPSFQFSAEYRGRHA